MAGIHAALTIHRGDGSRSADAARRRRRTEEPDLGRAGRPRRSHRGQPAARRRAAAQRDRDLRFGVGRVPRGLPRRVARGDRRGPAGAVLDIRQSRGDDRRLRRRARVRGRLDPRDIRDDRAGPPADRARRQQRWRSLHAMARARRREAEAGRGGARLDLQHHLFLRHDRRAQGHRPAARHALATRQALRSVRLWPGRGHPGLYAALFEYDPGQRVPRARGRRRHRADEEVRGARVSPARAIPPRDPRHAGARAIFPHHGAHRLRRIRPVEFSDEILHQRAVRRRAEAGNPAAMAGRTWSNITG